jgi:8-oxo-dGTP pyrophosphatase MutT (NUDIX family)
MIEEKLRGYVPSARSDLAQALVSAPQPFRPAAVLIPLVQRPEGLAVLFTRRAAHLRHHAGQFSFPGGKTEESDADASATALREAFEEIGLDHGNARVIGTLDQYVTVTGFKVTPVVAVVTPQEWRTDPGEVECIMEVPLSHILRDGVLAMQQGEVNSVRGAYYTFEWEGKHVWGATAGMLKNLAEVLKTDPAAPGPKNGPANGPANGSSWPKP